MFQNKDTKEGKLNASLQKRKNMFVVSEDPTAEHMQMHADLRGAPARIKPPNPPGDPLDGMDTEVLMFSQKFHRIFFKIPLTIF